METVVILAVTVAFLTKAESGGVWGRLQMVTIYTTDVKSVLVVGAGAGGPAGAVPLTDGVLVVVHPDLQNASLHSDFAAEMVDDVLVSLLEPPPHPLGEFHHPLFLIWGEFRSEALSPLQMRCRDGGSRVSRGGDGGIVVCRVPGRQAGAQSEQHLRRRRVVR
ncbi:unnamed protein product [Cuscuta epithymum]|uniref:Secreted protein n=1 Tax=Cuscuta epithymum TaxID=186058 RepID=A0AAV0FUL6_9ASTE|nr:unnamed protein product [Cuscuta epithymum]